VTPEAVRVFMVMERPLHVQGRVRLMKARKLAPELAPERK
jgi:hypothetical protein